MPAERLLIVTTVPETLATILRCQPRFLSTLFDVSVATSPGKTLDQVKANEGVDVHAVPMSRGISPLKDAVSIINMLRLLLSLRPDVVHSYTPKAGLVAMLAAWLCRVPVRVHTFTGLVFPTQTGLKRLVLIWIDRLICACATRVVPEGHGVCRDLQQFGITRKQASVIGHGNIAGVDTAYYSMSAAGVSDAAEALRARLGMGRDDYVYCFVGRLNRDKGVSELVQAFTGLPGNAHLVLVGGRDESAPVQASVMASVRAHDSIHELGFMDDIRPALAMANVLVLPSYREGFPNVVLQAGAMQRPVIATDVNGSNEAIEAGINGWLVPAREVEPLRAAMRQASTLPYAAWQTMGVEARRRVQERFERSAHWQRMASFYRACLDQFTR